MTPNRDNPFLVAMARALWVNAFADCVEETENNWNQDPPTVTCGADWMDVAPETPPEAFDMAFMLLGRFEAANRLSWPCIIAKAFKPEGLDVDDSELLDTFGHYVVQSCLGSGVSWEDDHENVGLEYPRTEACYLEDVVLEVLAKDGIRLVEASEAT